MTLMVVGKGSHKTSRRVYIPSACLCRKQEVMISWDASFSVKVAIPDTLPSLAGTGQERQLSPTFLALGTGFMEDDFSHRLGTGKMIWGWFKNIMSVVLMIIYLQMLPSASIMASALSQIIRHQTLISSHNLDPSHVQFTAGFELLWESNAMADLTGAGAQVVMCAVGKSYKHRWSFVRFPAAHLLLCGPSS